MGLPRQCADRTVTESRNLVKKLVGEVRFGLGFRLALIGFSPPYLKEIRRMDKQGQNLKAVTYQDIIELRDFMEKMASWQEPLAILDHFFQFRSGPINKKRIVKEYYARAQMFHAFYEDYNRLIELGDELVMEMVRAEKVETGFEVRKLDLE